MITCTRQVHFCAGHRVYGHENKCAHLHGHNYTVQIEAHGKLDGIGRVIDFSVLKEKIGGWIDRMWDHGFLLWNQDHEALDVMRGMKHQRVYPMRLNPTAENIAAFLLEVVCPDELAGTGVIVKKITVWETPNCYATAIYSK